MRFLLAFFLLISVRGFSQWKEYKIGVNNDTLNRVDKKDQKQGKWVIHHDELRGEPGYEEEGEFKDDRKEEIWRLYSLEGDVIGLERYKWGNKDSVCQYFTKTGELIREERWKALNPDKLYDTLEIEDIDHLDHYKTVIVKNEGVGIKNGEWRFYDPTTGMVFKTENYELGKLIIPKASSKNLALNDSTKAVAKPKEVQDFEKQRKGKKKIKYVDGSVNY